MHYANAKMQKLLAQKAEFEARVRECEESGMSWAKRWELASSPGCW